MWQIIKQLGVANVFPTICYLLAAYFFYAFCHVVGVPPDRPIDASTGSYIALALFLFMLPEAKKLRLGQLFEFEALVKEIKQEVRDFKEETRNTLSAYTTLVSAISNTVSQTINVHLPGQEVVNKAKDDLKQTLTAAAEDKPVEDKVDAFLGAAGGDANYALAKLRMQLERELRRILKKRTHVRSPSGRDIQYLSTRSLFNQFIEVFPAYERLSTSFDYILKVCNAAIHGQIVPDGHAHEALGMGVQMLSELSRIDL